MKIEQFKMFKHIFNKTIKGHTLISFLNIIVLYSFIKYDFRIFHVYKKKISKKYYTKNKL